MIIKLTLKGLVTGWATARFNLFGLKEAGPTSSELNYAGVALTLISTIFYLFVKNETKIVVSEEAPNQEATAKLNELSTNGVESDMISKSTEQNIDIYDRLNPKAKRIVGIALAVFSGLLYGEAFTPILYIKSNYIDASQNNLDCNYFNFKFRITFFNLLI